MTQVATTAEPSLADAIACRLVLTAVITSTMSSFTTFVHSHQVRSLGDNGDFERIKKVV